MAHMLRRFYAEVRSKDGKKYGSSSLRNIRASIQRHLENPPYSRTISVISDPEFKQANNMLDSMLKSLREEGLDEASHKENIDPADMQKLNSTLKTDNPVQLQELVFLDTMTHYGKRWREGLRSLKKDCFKFGQNAAGREYVEIKYNQVTKCDDGMKKKRKHGGGNLVTKEKEKRMWAETNGRCPVKTLKLYLSKLNPKNEYLFQRPNRSWHEGGRWYDNQVLGVHSLTNLMSKMSEKYDLSQRYTNHCIRASVVTELDKAGFGAVDICHVTGHKSTDSLKHYRTKVTSDRSQQLSSALHQFRTGCQMPSTSKETNTNPTEPSAQDKDVTQNQPTVPPTINFTRNLQNELISGILSGATFTGNVTFNFNMSK